eukprot:g7648.t1
MVATHADETPLGFAGDVDGSYSFSLSSGHQQHQQQRTASPPSISPSPNSSSVFAGASGSGGSAAPVNVELLSPPSLQDSGLVGGGVLLTGAEAGRTVLAWRAQESGLWLEERGLDDDLEGGGLHLKLQGGISSAGSVGVFGGEGGDPNPSAVAVCAYTEDRVVHRVVLQRPVAHPGEKAPSVLSATVTPQASKALRLACREAGHGPSCWINRNLLVIGGADGTLHCVRIVDGVDGQAASLSEETLRAKSGWNPLSAAGGGGSAKAVAITGYWQEEEKQAMVLTLHTDWSFRVWTTGKLGSRRGGGGSLLHKVDARKLLSESDEHQDQSQVQHQTAALNASGCFLSPVLGQEGYVVAAVAAEGGLPNHVVLLLPATGAAPQRCGKFEAPSDAGPLVDAYVDDNLTIWALWARPRGGGGGGGGGAGGAGAFGGGVCSYGNVMLNAVHHHTIDEWLGREEEEDGVFDDLLRTKGGWAGLVSLRSPPQEVQAGQGAGGARAVTFAAVELMESFYLRRMFSAGRFGRRALASAIREALPLLSQAGPLSSNSTSLQDLQDLEGGYKRKQEVFLESVRDTLLGSAAGARLAEAAATILQTDAVRDVIAWAESLKPAREAAQSRPLGHRGGVRSRSAGIATAAAFGTVKLLKRRMEEARNTAVVLMLVLEQVGREGLPEQLEANIVADALPLTLKCMNQYALAAEVGSHRLRVRAGGTLASSLGGGGGVGGAQPATVAASKPWGCTALEGLFLDGQGVVQDYWAMMATAHERRRALGLGGLPALLAGMCEGTLRSPFRGLDSGGLVAFLHASDQYQLALPLIGLAVEWQWRMKVEPGTAVLTAIARGFLYSAEAAARSEGGGSLSAGPLLDQATKWYIKASQALRASLFRTGGGGGGGGAESVVAHFEDALGEVERVRDRVKRGGGGGGSGGRMRMGMGLGGVAAGEGGGAADEGDEEGEDFGGRGAVNALELARAALAAERKLRPSSAADQQHRHVERQARLCQVVFKHASEALSFEEAFAAVCENPADHRRKENLEALAQHMCECGRLGQLCLLPLDDCPPYLISGGQGWRPSDVVEGALWGLARGSNVADLVEEGVPLDGAGGGGGGGRKRSRRRRGSRANYFNCLYALYMARGQAVEGARAQDELRERLEAHPAASTLPFAAAAQRARLAALNALAVAPEPYRYSDGAPSSCSSSSAAGAAGAYGDGENGGDAVASICPPVEERRLDSAGRPAGVRTAAVLGREAVAAAAAIVVAEDSAAAEAGAAAAAEGADWAVGGRKMRGAARKGGYAGAVVAAGEVSVTVVTRAGVSGVLEALRSAGRFEEAADVALRGLDQPRTMVDEMNKVVRDLALACVKAEDVAQGFEHGPIPPLERGVGPLKPRVPLAPAAVTEGASLGVAVRTEAAERAASLWPVLRQLLRLDSADNGFSYHATAAKVLLEGMPASTLPQWLEDSYLGRPQLLPDPPADANAFPTPQPRALLAPWKVFTPGSEGDSARAPPDPTALLDMYVFDGRLEEACCFLSRLLDVEEVADVGALTKLTPEAIGGTDFLPYASIDRLFALCEASLTRQSAAPTAGTGKAGANGLSRAFETAQERLTQYFKIAKATSDQAQPNRAAAAAAAAAGGGDFSNTSAFMLTD